MPLSADSITWNYTDDATAATNTLSLGGTVSPNTITNNRVFDDVTGDESSAGDIEYRAIGIVNTDPSYNWQNVRLWCSGYVKSTITPDTIYFGTEQPTGTIGSPPGEIQTIPVEGSAPTGITWFSEEAATIKTAGATLSGNTFNNGGIGTIGTNDWAGIWLRRDVPGGASAFNNRSCTLTAEGETTASPFMYIRKSFVINWNEGYFFVTELPTEYIPKATTN